MNKINKFAALMVIAIAPSCSIMAQQLADTAKVNVAFGTVEKQDMLGGVSAIDIKELMKKDNMSAASDGLNSLIGGYDGYNAWGQTPMVLVDGMPRDISKVAPTQIDQITVLKSASAVMLYGSRASKGAVLITTKRGKEKPLSIDMRVNTGFYVPKSYPQYLNAAEYMTLYNEACVNDGLKPKYSDDVIWNTAAGTNPARYPDLKFYNSDNLRKAYNKTEVVGEISGGTDRAHYYANFGARYNNGLVKTGEHKNDNNWRFNVNANVDMKITKWLSASTSAGVIIEDAYNGRGDFWSTASSLRPNWYNPLLPIDQMDMTNKDIATIVENANWLIDGKYLPGGLSTNTTSFWGDSYVAGYIRDKYRDFMFQVALNADLSMITKGLSFRAAFDIDYWDYYSEGFSNDYATYEPIWANMNGKDMIVGLTKYNNDKQATQEFVGSSSDSQTMMFSAQFDYRRTFAKQHNVAATLVGWGWQKQTGKDGDHDTDNAVRMRDLYHRTSNVNLGLNVDYNFARKYYVQAGGSIVHSAKLAEGHRQALSHSFGLGWRLSKEKFMQNIDWVDDLKISGAYTLLNQDIDLTDYYMYKGYYDPKGIWYQWADNSQGGFSTSQTRGDNDKLKMIQRKEWRIGLTGQLFKGFVDFDVNLFTQDTNGMITNGANTSFPSWYNSIGSFLPNMNYNCDRRQGIDYAINFKKKIGEVEAQLGFTGMLYKDKAILRDENNGVNTYLNNEGQSLTAMWGYTCLGYFTAADFDADGKLIEGIPNHTFSEVKPGDLRYKDINEDGVVDGKDVTVIGNATPSYIYGVNLTLKWKDFTLFARGTGQAGGMLSKSGDYWWPRAEVKYSEVALGRWTPETAATATYPRLTTTGNSNNYRTSNYWTYSTNQFTLDKVQLTYDLPDRWFAGKVVKDMSVYFSGSNLFTIAPNRKILETSTYSPMTRFYNIGATIRF